MGNYQKAIEAVDRGLRIAKHQSDTHGIIQCLHTKGWIHFLVGEFDEAQLCAQKALDRSRKINDKRSVSLCLNVIQAAADGLGNYGKALEINEECIAIGRELGDQLIVSRGLCNQGEHFRKQQKFRKSISCYEESLEISRELDQKNLICITLHNLGFALNQLGNFDDARKCCRESLTLALEIDAYALALHSVLVMAEILSLNHQAEESAQMIGAVCAHPMFTHEHSYESDRIISILEKELSESAFRSAIENGKKLDIDDVFRTILLAGDQE